MNPAGGFTQPAFVLGRRPPEECATDQTGISEPRAAGAKRLLRAGPPARIDTMEQLKSKRRDGMTRSFCGLLLRGVGCLVATASLLPMLVLGPGTTLIHDHCEEDYHTHKVSYTAEGHGTTRPGSGHDHPAGTLDGLEGAHFFLTLPELPRLSLPATSSVLRMKSCPPPVVFTSVPACDTVSSAAALGVRDRPVAPLRAHDTMTCLLLGGHSLLL